MKAINAIALTVAIIGCVNWGLIGLFNFNLVETLFGNVSFLSKLIYIAVGIAGIWSIAFYNRVTDENAERN